MRRFMVLAVAQVAAVLLLVSSLEHLINPFRFLDGVLQYQLVNFQVARMVAATLPMVSLVSGLAALFPRTRRSGLLMTGILGSLFVTVQVTALARDLAIDCGCFDPFRSTEISWRSLLLPVGLTVGGFLGFWGDRSDEKTNTVSSTASTTSPQVV